MQETTQTLAPTLYAHSTRPQWGLAILAWEGRDKRRYQFQDGKLRTFKRGYYQMIEPVSETEGRPEQIVRDLKTMLRASPTYVEDAQVTAPTKRTRASGVSVDEQIASFRATYPEGFADPKYLKGVRGEGASSSRKRHVTQSIEMARADLSLEALDRRVAADDSVGVRDALAALLRSTDLTAPKDASAVAKIPDDRARDLVEALRDVLHGSAPFVLRFTRWVQVLQATTGTAPSWPLVTAPLALVHPAEHLCVRPTVFRRQAKRLAPDLKWRPMPSVPEYEKLRTMASALSTRLEQAGMPPRDLVDVYQFVWTTLRRKALDEVEG